jgi:hypothetical protein
MNSRGHERKRGRDPQQIRIREQFRANLHHGSDDLERPESIQVSQPTGSSGGMADRNDDDETDGDDFLDESSVDDSAQDSTTSLLTDELDPQTSAVGRLSIREVFGSRPPVVLAHVSIEPDSKVKICIHLTVSASKNVALEWLRCFLIDRFEFAQAHLPAAEWNEITGQTAATPVRRLLLLNRLAVTGEHEFPGADKYQVKVSELGLERYRYKLASLPDGLPFSIGLLVAGGAAGNKGQDDNEEKHPFQRLPMALRLLAWRQTLHREQDALRLKRLAKPWADEQLAAALREELQNLTGISMPEMQVDLLRRFRDELKREAKRTSDDARAQNALLRLAGNKSDRKKQYQESPPPPSEFEDE